MELYTLLVSDHITKTVERHAHNYYQFIYCQRGVGTISIGSCDCSAIPGKGYLVKPLVEHSIMPKGEMRLIEFKFTVTSEKLNDSLMQLPYEFEIDEHLSLRMSIKEVIKEGFSKSIYNNESTNAALLIFFIRLLRNQDIKGEDITSRITYFDPYVKQPANSDAAEFLKVIDYIEEHLSEPFTLNDLAELVRFDKSYFILRFNEVWGTSPMKYANHLRIERAKMLLATTDKTITAIAGEVGFQSIHYFSRYFKEKVNITPNDYRIKIRKGKIQ